MTSIPTTSRADSLKTWPVIWQIIRHQAGVFALHSLFTLIVFGLQVFPGLIEKSIFDALTGGSTAPSGLWWLIALLVGVEVARLVTALGAEWYGWTFRYVIGALMSSNIFASILRRPGDHGLPVSPGEAINRLRNDADEVADFPLWLPEQAGKILAAVIAVIIMARINLTMTLVIFVPLLGIMVFTRLAWGRILKYNRATAAAEDAVTGFLGETFDAVQAVKVANAEVDVAERFGRLNDARGAAAVRENLFRGLLDSTYSSTVTFGIGVMLLLAGQAIMAGTFTVGDFALFVSYMWFTTQVPIEIGTFVGDYKTQEVSIERMVDLIRPEPPSVLVGAHPVYERGPLPDMPFTPKTVEHHLHRLEVRGLTYHYPDSERGIENVHLTLERGSFTVITGRIGSGKSTLARVLIGLLPKEAGEIRWNGGLVDDPVAFFRPPRCAHTAQVPRLFSDTLRDNILLGWPVDHADLASAIHRSVLEPDIAALDKGLDTLVGPRGIRL